MILEIHSDSFSRKLTIDTNSFRIFIYQMPTHPALLSHNLIDRKVPSFSFLQDLKFKAILITEPQNQLLLCQSFEMLQNEKKIQHMVK